MHSPARSTFRSSPVPFHSPEHSLRRNRRIIPSLLVHSPTSPGQRPRLMAEAFRRFGNVLHSHMLTTQGRKTPIFPSLTKCSGRANVPDISHKCRNSNVPDIFRKFRNSNVPDIFHKFRDLTFRNISKVPEHILVPELLQCRGCNWHRCRSS
jgi:hypothetical protein